MLFGFTTNDLSHDDTFKFYLRTNDCDALLKTKYMKKWARDNFQQYKSLFKMPTQKRLGDTSQVIK